MSGNENITESRTLSRIGSRPIAIPQGVTIEINTGSITVKGPKGELTQ